MSGGGREVIAFLALAFNRENGTHIALSPGSPTICTK